MTRRLMLAVCWLCWATYLVSQNATVRLSAVVVGLTFGFYLTLVALRDPVERRWTMSMFGLAIVVWLLTEWLADGYLARMVGFWTFVVVAVAAVAPAGARFFDTLGRRAFQVRRVRTILRKSPEDLTEANDYLRSIN